MVLEAGGGADCTAGWVVALLPSTYRDLVVFSLLLALIIMRPHGILGQPRVQKV